MQPSIDEHLAQLETAGLIRRAAQAADGEFTFRHVLMQEAAYQSLLKQDRRRLHEAVGRCLERLGPPQAEAIAPILGIHFYEAGNDARALHYLTLAADDAARRYANAEAIMLLDRAIEVAMRSGDMTAATAALVLKRGRLLEMCGDHASALASYTDLEQRSTDDRIKLDALLALATVHSAPTSQYNSARASGYLEQALAIARRLGDRAAEARALWLHLLRSKFNRDMSGARVYGEQALAIARELGLKELLAYVLNDIFPVLTSFGMPLEARAALGEAEGLWRELGNQALLVDTLCNLAELDAYGGNLESSRRLTREALKISQDIGNLWGQAYSTLVASFAAIEQAHYAEAFRLAEEGIALSHQAGFAVGLFFPRATMAFMLAELGMPKEGLATALQGVRVAEEKLPSWLPLPYAAVIHCQVQLGDRDAAERTLAAAPTDAHTNEIAGVYLPRVIAELRGLQADFAGMLEQTDQARSAFELLGMYALLPSVEILRAQALRGLDRGEEAVAVLNHAIAMATQKGLRRELWRMHALLATYAAQRGDVASATAARRAAREELDFVLTQIDRPMQRNAFLAMPEVRALRDAA